MKLLRTLALAYLYYPHLWLMRAMGPYGAVFLSRGLACVHWLGTFFGAEGRARSAIAAALPQLPGAPSLATILRRYLMVKYQNFVEWHLYPTSRGQRYVRDTYCTIEGRERLDQARAEGRGAVLLVYHFGLVKMAFPALAARGYVAHQHVFRGATYAGQTYDWMAKAAMRKLAEMEQCAGLPVIYHRPLATLLTLLRCLRRGEFVAMNGDGMMGEDFAEVRFLNGTIALPTGPVELAARSGAPILPLFALPQGLYGHRIVVHPPIRVASQDHDCVAAALADCAALLEQYVRRQPWSWWTWRRLRVATQPGGTTVYHIQALRGEIAITDGRPPTREPETALEEHRRTRSINGAPSTTPPRQEQPV